MTTLGDMRGKSVYVEGERIGTLVDVAIDGSHDGWQTVNAVIAIDDEGLEGIEAITDNRPIQSKTRRNGIVSDEDRQTYATYLQNAKVSYVRNGRVVGGSQPIPAGRHESE